jgi:hypothetical protein
MSGLGFKTFTAGDVLTAADVNGYLMSQALMVFDDGAARDAALTSPAEGMTVYEKDSNNYAVYDGSVWVYQGRYRSYTPTFTGFTLGNGTVSFNYAVAGNVVIVQAEITLGSTSAVTATSPNSFSYSLPLNAGGFGSSATGMGNLLDTSLATRVPIATSVATATTATVFWIETVGAVAYYNAFSTTTSPFALASTDQFSFILVYGAA